MEETANGTVSDELLERLKELLERERGRLKALRKALERVSTAEDFLKMGRMIQANLNAIPKGAKEVELTDFDGEVRRIELDPAKSPVQNMELYFRLYKKMKSGREKVKELMATTEKRIAELEALVEDVGCGRRLDEAEKLVRELSARRRRKGEKRMRRRLRKFVSSDGYEIYVGRNERENDYLSLRFARRDDLFLHASGYAGSHIIVRTEGKEVPESTLQEAAMLAVYYSKARRRGGASVSVARCADVRKPKGFKPGTVTIRNFRVMEVRIDETVIERLLSQLEEETG